MGGDYKATRYVPAYVLSDTPYPLHSNLCLRLPHCGRLCRTGRWIDFRNDYKTMNMPFMESEWSVRPHSPSAHSDSVCDRFRLALIKQDDSLHPPHCNRTLSGCWVLNGDLGSCRGTPGTEGYSGYETVCGYAHGTRRYEEVVGGARCTGGSSRHSSRRGSSIEVLRYPYPRPPPRALDVACGRLHAAHLILLICCFASRM
jgi:hypothetical protein